jgi:hypothetical protein
MPLFVERFTLSSAPVVCRRRSRPMRSNAARELAAPLIEVADEVDHPTAGAV